MPDHSHQPRPDALTEDQQGRIKRHVADQDRTLLAMQQLESALAAAAPRREQAWRDEVRSDIEQDAGAPPGRGPLHSRSQ